MRLSVTTIPDIVENGTPEAAGIGVRTDTTQKSGQTPDKEVEIKNITVYSNKSTNQMQ